MMRRMCLLLMLSACVRNQGGALQLRDMVQPQPPMCTADPAATIINPGGTRDVSLLPLSTYGYIAAPRMFNNLQPTAEEPVRVGLRQNVRNEQNVISMKGFNVCYEFQNSATPSPERVPECEDLGGAEFLEYAGAAITVNIAATAILDLFPPRLTNNGNDPRFAVNPGDPSKRVIVHLQAVGFTLDGREVQSNEMTFPVDLCAGCLSLSPLVFGDPVSGGVGCASGKTNAADLCVPGQDRYSTCTFQ